MLTLVAFAGVLGRVASRVGLRLPVHTRMWDIHRRCIGHDGLQHDGTQAAAF